MEDKRESIGGLLAASWQCSEWPQLACVGPVGREGGGTVGASSERGGGRLPTPHVQSCRWEALSFLSEPHPLIFSLDN